MARQSSTSTSASQARIRAERYLRTGTPVPMIYWATTRHLAQAIGHARYASTTIPGEHTVEAVRQSGREILQVWEDGVCTWDLERAELTIT